MDQLTNLKKELLNELRIKESDLKDYVLNVDGKTNYF